MPEPAAPQLISIWDFPTRLFHWTLLLGFVVLWGSGRMGRLDVHMQVGTATLALLVFRLGWGVVGSPTSRFATFVRGPAAIREYLRGRWAGIGHNPLGALSVVAMLALLLAQAVTGLFATDDIASDGPLAWMVSSSTTKALSALHRLNSWILLGMVGLHLAAIAFYRVKTGRNLVHPMITGLGEAPGGATAPRHASPVLAMVVLAASAGLVFGVLAIWGR
jgi:cytochrome b